MFVDVSHYCKSCRDCAMKKAPRSGHKAPLIPIPVEGPFHRVGVDCLGPLPMTTSGNRYIVCLLTISQNGLRHLPSPRLK